MRPSVMPRALGWMTVATLVGCGAAPVVPHAVDLEVRSLEWLVGCWRDRGIDDYLEIEWRAESDGLRGEVRAHDVGSWQAALRITRSGGGIVLSEETPSGRFFGRVVSGDPPARLLATAPSMAVFEGFALSLAPEGGSSSSFSQTAVSRSDAARPTAGCTAPTDACGSSNCSGGSDGFR